MAEKLVKQRFKQSQNISMVHTTTRKKEDLVMSAGWLCLEERPSVKLDDLQRSEDM